MVGIATACEFLSGISVSLQMDHHQHKSKQKESFKSFQEFWTVPLSVADQSEDVLLQIQPTEFHLPFSANPTFWDYVQWSEVLVCSLLPVQPQNYAFCSYFPSTFTH